MTAIQQVTAVSAAINGGTLFQPYIVKRLIEPETREIIQENNLIKVRNVISKETSQKVRYVLESVVALGVVEMLILKIIVSVEKQVLLKKLIMEFI